MRILMMTYEIAEKGGNFIRCFSLARELVKLGHSVTILASNNIKSLHSKTYMKDGVTIVEIACILPYRNRHDGTSPFQILNRIRFINKNEFDLVHGFGHRPTVFIPSLYFKLFRKKPYFADWSDLWGWGGLASYRGRIKGTLVAYFDDYLEKITYRTANALTAISEHLFDKGKKIRTKHTYKLEVGCDVTEIKPLSKLKMRQKYELPLETPIVVFLGNAPYDAKFLAQSFIELQKNIPNIICLFVGAQMPEFDNEIANHRLNDHVIHKGFVHHFQIGELLACGDVMLLPYSDRELNWGRYPNKVGDYMASSRPIVANPTGEIQKLFSTYQIGILAKEDSKIYAAAVKSLLDNPELSDKLGKNARHVAETQLSWQVLAKKLESYYEKYFSSV